MMFYVALIFLQFIGAYSSKLSSQERVVGGTDAKPGEIPYIVSIRISAYHICGGTILDALRILTAAHCVVYKIHYLSVQYGVTKISSSENVIKVAEIFKHPGFRSLHTENDVAVIKLEEPLSFSEFVQTITLPEQDEQIPANTWGVLAGWGSSYTEGENMENLQRVDLIIYDDEDCKAAHGSNVDDFHNLCGGVPEGGKGQCSGDSGGPLVAGNGKQYGIVSWSVKPCTVKGYPGVYTRVTSYIDWINAQRKL